MFATVIKDAYRKGEEEQIADALQELCCASDTYGWASAGIYSFWDYDTKEVYYIGLAVDLEERFRQHNGLISVDSASCKKDKIDEYFDSNEVLGYSIFVQSPLSQPVTHKNKDTWKGLNPDVFGVADLRASSDRDDLKRVEGILIEAYRRVHGVFPKWNQVGGSIAGQKSCKIGNYSIVDDFTKEEFSPLVARMSLRELATEGNEKFAWYENYLHGVRMHMLYHGMSFGEARAFACRFDTLGTDDRIKRDAYLSRTLTL